MNIISKIKKIFIKNKLLIPEYTDYPDSVIELKESIINSIPPDLNQLETAYFIYIELGKRLSEHPANALEDFEYKRFLSSKHIDSDLQGNCKAIAEFYVNILKDSRVNIDADLTTVIKSFGAHVDAVIKIDNQQYITNLIGDLSRIQTGKRVRCFGFNLQEHKSKMYRASYKENMYNYYPNLSFIPVEVLEKLDKKFGYSFCPKSEIDSNKPGIYTEDVFYTIFKELSEPENYRKYILKGKHDVPKEDILKYKLEFLLDNMSQFSTYPGKEPNYLENIRYYYYSLNKFFTVEEGKRLNLYACNDCGDLSNIYSIIRLRTPKKDTLKNDYYMYNQDVKKYMHISIDELHDFLKEHPNLEISGERDVYNPADISALEL